MQLPAGGVSSPPFVPEPNIETDDVSARVATEFPFADNETASCLPPGTDSS